MVYNPFKHAFYLLLTEQKCEENLIIEKIKSKGVTLTEDELAKGITQLVLPLGLAVLKVSGFLQLTFSNEIIELYSKKEEKEQSRDITPAQKEVLACVIYSHKISKQEIDIIRGVDSRSPVMELIKHNLIEFNSDKKLTYTSHLLNSLSLQSIENIDNYNEIKESLSSFLHPAD